MTLIKKTTASLALVALTSGLFVNGVSAYTQSEVEAANFLADKGIVVKQSNPADYQLDRQVLRQEIAAVARGRAGVEKTSTCENMFRDVSATRPNTWACYTVEALANKGLIAKNANFRPEDNITKAEAVGMIVKAAYGDEYAPVAGNGDWQKQVVDFAVSKGIVSNFTNYTTPATRGFVFEVTRKTYTETPVSSEVNPLCALMPELCETPSVNKEEEPKETPATNNVRSDSNLVVKLSPESPSNGIVAANTPRAVMLAFDVTAGKEDVTLNKASLKFTGTGDHTIVEDLAIYSNGVKLTKNDGTFNSKLTSTLSFDKNTVVKAGETKTLYVTAKIVPSTETYNQMVRVALTDLEASATVIGAELNGATLTPYKIANKSTVTATSTVNKGNLYVGQDTTIYTLTLRETSKKEDVVLESITFEEFTGNTVDLDNLADLSITVNGKEVPATFTYSKTKIVASLNEKIAAGANVTVALKGQIIDDLTKTLALKATDIYMTGATTGTATDVTDTGVNEIVRTINGSNINFSFNRNGSSEVSQNSDDVLVGELVFVTTTDYSATITVAVSGATAYYEDLQLDNDIVKGSNNTFVFKNVDLSKGTTTLPLTVDIKDEDKASGKLTFTVTVSDIEDEVLGTKLTTSVLNNKSLTKSVTIVKSGLTVADKAVNNTLVTPKDNPEVVLYKGLISVNGSEDITVNNMTFEGTLSDAGTVKTDAKNLEDILSGITLNIGGKTFSGDVNNNTLEFNSVFATIAQGAKNVEFLVSAVLTDRVLDDNTLEQVKLTTLSADLTADKATPTNITKQAINSTLVTIQPKTTLTVVVSNDNEKTEVAGAQNTTIGSFRVNSTSTDIYVDELTIAYDVTENNNTKFNSVNNVRLMNGSTVLATGIINEANKVVEFTNFTLPTLSKTTTLTIVADLPAITTEGGLDKTFVGTIAFTTLNLTSEDASASNVAVNSKTVTVVPAKSTIALASSDRFGKDDAIATVKVGVSKDNASEIETLRLESLEFNSSFDASKVVSIQVAGKHIDATDSAKVTAAGSVLTIVDGQDITDIKDFNIEITVNSEEAATNVYLNKVNIKALAGDNAYDVMNETDNVINLGSYSISK